MRWMVLLVLASVLSGCLVQGDDTDTQSSDDASTTGSSHSNTTVTMSLTRSPAPGANHTGNATGNATGPAGNATGNQTGNATLNETTPSVVVFQQSFSGSLPVDGLDATHPFDVPAGATRVEVTYTSDHIGLFTALAHVDDAGGERINSSDACGFGDTGAAVNTCLMLVDQDVAAGAWSVGLTWQVGQATEDYTFDVVVYGVPA
jgi:hypothetical protein